MHARARAEKVLRTIDFADVKNEYKTILHTSCVVARVYKLKIIINIYEPTRKAVYICGTYQQQSYRHDRRRSEKKVPRRIPHTGTGRLSID